MQLRIGYPSDPQQIGPDRFLVADYESPGAVAIDPLTGALVWQYGETGAPGTAAGLLNTPDGLDILGPGGTTPTHPATG